MRVDGALVERLEHSAAQVAAATVAALGVSDEPDGAASVDFAGGALVAMGPGRYVNRAVGVTMTELDDDALAELETFYARRRLRPMLEVSAWAPALTVDRLRRRGYRVEWFRSMFAGRPLPSVERPTPTAGAVRIVVVTAAERDHWLEVLAVGNGLTTEGARRVSDEFALASAATTGTVDLLAVVDDIPVGCGSLQEAHGVGWLGGAATRPEWRGRGIQTALIDERVRIAADRGLAFVAATALPAGGSARNLRAAGLVHVQDQVVMSRRRGGGRR